MRTWKSRAPAVLSLFPGQVEAIDLPVDSDAPLEILWRAGDGVRIDPDPSDPRRVSVCVIDDSAPFARVSWTLVTPPEEYGSVSIRVLRPPAPPPAGPVSLAATPLPAAPPVAPPKRSEAVMRGENGQLIKTKEGSDCCAPDCYARGREETGERGPGT